MRNQSRTWDEFGQYGLDTYLESRIGVEGAGLFGFDDISLGWTGDGLPTVNNQSVAGVISSDFKVGSLALNARPVNFTDHNNPIPSLLQSLRNISTPIPSLSWSYTAGAYNLAPKVFGSLVLGGYDSSRFQPNNLTFPFGADISLDLQVVIQRITVNASTDALLSQPIVSYISTLVPDIWLPLDACTEFAKAFGLSFNTSSNNYYVNNTAHQSNLAKNSVVTFQVGPEVASSSIAIRLPYWNFHLVAETKDSDPSTTGESFRFPIRRASNDSQYILGRAFLQSAHLSVDYERRSFNLSQALYPSSSVKQSIVPILHPGQESEDRSPRDGLTKAAVAGMIVGAVIAVLVIALGSSWYCWRRKSKARMLGETDDTEVQGIIAHEMAADEKKWEMQDGAGLKHEMMGDTDPKIELSAGMDQEKPVEAASSIQEVFELPADGKRSFESEDGRSLSIARDVGDRVRKDSDVSDAPPTQSGATLE